LPVIFLKEQGIVIFLHFFVEKSFINKLNNKKEEK